MSLPPPRTTKRSKHFTAFYSVAEEAMAKAEEESRENEGGHMSSTCGRVVCTPGAALPYKAVLARAGQADSERAFATMREAEAFIRRNTPTPAVRSTLYDRGAGDTSPTEEFSNN
jgi:hypothetical protein